MDRRTPRNPGLGASRYTSPIYRAFTWKQRRGRTMRLMRNRRFLLATLVAALGVALWLVSPGLALRNAVVKQGFGAKLVRLEVIEKKPVGGSTDWRIDHGVITGVSSTQLTLREADGRIQDIPLHGSPRIVRHGRTSPPSRLHRHQVALVT